MKLYPSNKPQNFTTMLAKPIELTGRWCVALRSIAFPNNSSDISETNLIQVLFHVGRRVITLDIEIKDIRVSSIQDLCRYLQMVFRERLFNESDSTLADAIEAGFNSSIPISVTYSEYTMKVQIQSGAVECTINFEHATELQAMLGIENTKFDYSQNNGTLASDSFVISHGNPVIALPIFGTKAASYKSQKPGFFIYTDIIKPTRVGDSFSKLLQYAPFNKDSLIGYKEYINPMYFELESNIIHTIQIRLCDSSGKDIKFPAGQTNLQLEFKRADLE